LAPRPRHGSLPPCPRDGGSDGCLREKVMDDNLFTRSRAMELEKRASSPFGFGRPEDLRSRNISTSRPTSPTPTRVAFRAEQRHLAHVSLATSATPSSARLGPLHDRVIAPPRTAGEIGVDCPVEPPPRPPGPGPAVPLLVGCSGSTLRHASALRQAPALVIPTGETCCGNYRRWCSQRPQRVVARSPTARQGGRGRPRRARLKSCAVLARHYGAPVRDVSRRRRHCPCKRVRIRTGEHRKTTPLVPPPVSPPGGSQKPTLGNSCGRATSR
jgi:hypothetical protein